jgi:hypothetical protein
MKGRSACLPAPPTAMWGMKRVRITPKHGPRRLFTVVAGPSKIAMAGHTV